MTDKELVQKLREFLHELEVTLSADYDGELYLHKNSGGFVDLGNELP